MAEEKKREPSNQPTKNNQRDRRESGAPGGGQGRRDEVGRSGVYPMSGPHPPGNAPIRTEAAWGQGERGAAGYKNHGRSELSYQGGQVLGGYEGPSGDAGPGPEAIEYRSSDIPHGEWRSFLDNFSRQHEGWLVTVEIAGAEISGLEAENLKLDGITSEHSEGHDRISIALGKSADDHLTHFIVDPVRLMFLEAASGGHVGLAIEAADGSRTMVRFRGPAKPETLDHVAA